ncbi:MAG TPA: bifunctional 4-hydroxy-2-oxoglutarate aldolase/2-dehydro-3-deoxy-phosphogluconate aldolase [Anaeromyxobacter sp.]|nr:bifunctional 4-hydroxy-2-oxoglutarate aldolase/2-dehydro-3-deoxy-phosphogluconate aldolase [Anaeromyxobacter sp.]
MSENAQASFPAALRARIRRAGVVAVLVIEDVEKAVPLAETLVASGVNIMELAMRTRASMDALEAIASRVPDMIPGVGTILRPDQLVEAKRRGAVFAVAPGTNRAVIEAALANGMPMAPGIAVPSDIETALEYGCRILKFFPAEPQGGLGYLRAIHAPYAHLGLEYIPLGGVSEANCREYLAERSVIAVGGSWIAPRERIAAGDFTSIGQAAARAARACRREERDA